MMPHVGVTDAEAAREWVHVPCGFCDGTASEELCSGKTDAGLPFTIARCAACGLSYLNPRPTAARLMDYYPPDYAPHGAFSRALTLRDRLKLMLLQRGRPGRSLFGRLAAAAANVAIRPLVGQIVEFVPGGRILDVGCGNGWNVRLYSTAGWDAWGVEPNAAASNYARRRGLNVRTGTLIEAAFPSASFDAVTMYQVLEHLPDPKRTLTECHRILKPGGQLVVSVPNIDCYDRQVFGSGWIPLDVPRHLYHFSMTSLPAMLSECGFAVERVKPQYLFFSATLEDYRRFLSRLGARRRTGELTAAGALRAAAVTGNNAFCLKLPRFVTSTNRVGDFSFYLHAYARKA